jgi:hypothetical protein
MDISSHAREIHTGISPSDRAALTRQRAASEPVSATQPRKENFMSLGTILLIVLILLLVGAIPSWPYSRSWGYAPSGVLGLVVLIIVVLLLMGRL